MRAPGPARLLRRGWSRDPLWAGVYDHLVEHPGVGAPAWALGFHSDLRLLYAAAAEISRLPRGSRVLDVPCGGGVALRGLRPGQGVEYVGADIAPTMLARTLGAARERGLIDQVSTQVADVEDLPFEDGSFDLVVSFTGLHCFGDPAAAVVEMTRVLAPGGVLSGSALLNDTGRRFAPLRTGGRLGGLLGPGCTSTEVRTWLRARGCVDVDIRLSGAMGYFRAVKP